LAKFLDIRCERPNLFYLRDRLGIGKCRAFSMLGDPCFRLNLGNFFNSDVLVCSVRIRTLYFLLRLLALVMFIYLCLGRRCTLKRGRCCVGFGARWMLHDGYFNVAMLGIIFFCCH